MRFSIPAEPSARSAGLAALALFVLGCGYNLIRYDFTDTAYFGGDVWYYQSIAVNLVAGDGYRFGAAQPFDDYRYGPALDTGDGEHYQKLKEKFLALNRADFYGSPGFPLFLAGVYRVVGVHPLAIKLINVVLIALAAALIPLISVCTWRRHGLTTGTLVSLYFIFVIAPKPNYLVGEPLIMFLLAAWGLFFAYLEKRITVRSVATLAVLTAILILVKSYALLVLLTAAFIAVKHRPWRSGLVLAVLYVVIVAGMILPWSVYATRHSDRVVVISTQLDNLIMDGNNEDAISGGGWAPWWRKKNAGDPKYLYNRLADSNLSTSQKVGRFYRENWTRLPELFANKIYSATGRHVSVILILLTFSAYYGMGLRRNRRLHRAGQVGDIHLPAFPLFCFVVWLTNTLVAFGLLRYTLIFLPFMLITAAQAPLEFWRLRQADRC